MSFKNLLAFAITGLLILFGLATYALFEYTIQPEIQAQKHQSLFMSAETIERNFMDVLRSARDPLESWILKAGLEGPRFVPDLSALMSATPFDYVKLFKQTPAGNWMEWNEAPVGIHDLDLLQPEALDAKVKFELSQINNRLFIRLQSENALGLFRLDPTQLAIDLDNLSLLKWPTGEVIWRSKNLSVDDAQRIGKSLNQGALFSWIDSTASGEAMVVKPISNLGLATVTFGATTQLESKWEVYRLLYLALLGLGLGIGLIFINKLSSILSRGFEGLVELTSLIAQQNYDKLPPPRSNIRETVWLHSAITKMAQQIQDYVDLQKRIVERESELKTAEAVQNALLPSGNLMIKEVQLNGFNKMAGSCGGDLWGYWNTTDFLYFYVCDVTGHGVAAALISSAAKSTFASHEALGEANLIHLSEHLNHVVSVIGKDRFTITAFLGCLEKKTGRIQFINHSHPEPFLLGSSRYPFIDEDCIYPPLGSVSEKIARLGSIQLSSDEALVLISDGVFELDFKGGKPIREKQFIKLLNAHFESTRSEPAIFLDDLTKELFQFHSSDLKDDVTLVHLQRSL